MPTTQLTPSYVIDSTGQKVAVLLEVGEYERLMERAGEMETLRGFMSRPPDDSNAVFAGAVSRGDEMESLGLRSFP